MWARRRSQFFVLQHVRYRDPVQPHRMPGRDIIQRLVALLDQWRRCSDGLESFQSRLTITTDTHVFLCLLWNWISQTHAKMAHISAWKTSQCNNVYANALEYYVLPTLLILFLLYAFITFHTSVGNVSPVVTWDYRLRISWLRINSLQQDVQRQEESRICKQNWNCKCSWLVLHLERTNTSPKYSAKMNELGYQITAVMMVLTAATTSSMVQRSC